MSAINYRFQEAIRCTGRSRQLIMEECETFRRMGKTQKECQAEFTATFKTEFPNYNFTDPMSNLDYQRHIYSNIRKAISDYFKQFKPVVVQTVAATTAPEVAQQVPPSHIGIAQQPTSNDSPALAAQLTRDQLEELVLNAGKEDVSWAKTLAMKLMAL